ncbi:MAG: hypothetical protein IJZ68_05740 [Bacteroidaceae bacterium]|nr:hypothetical protein [Bacteroidaceae bacterium]
MKKLLSITLVIVMLLSLAGCKDMQFAADRIAIPMQTRQYTGAKYLRTEQVPDEESDATSDEQVHYFKGKNFEFTVREFYTYNSIFPTHTVSTNYYEKMLEHESVTLNAILASYGYPNVRYKDEFHGVNQQEALEKGSVVVLQTYQRANSYSTPSISIMYYVANADEEENIRKCADELYEALSDYMCTNPTAPFNVNWHVGMYYVTQTEEGITDEHTAIEHKPFYNTTGGE